MTGALANKICPTCGGELQNNIATIPFILNDDMVIVIKKVPAEVCGDCHEPFMAGGVTDRVMALLNQLKSLRSEVSVVSFPNYVAA
jgi:YgiT-type zinc finger domain-containing protein